MDLIAQYEIPFLHPLLVHFPLVMLLLGAAAAGLYLVLGRAAWRQAGLVLFALGALSAGARARPATHCTRPSRATRSWTRWSGATRRAPSGRCGRARSRRSRSRWCRSPRLRRPRPPAEGEEPAPPPRREPLWGRLVVVAPAWAAAAAVAWTAHLGGIMVWGVPR